MLSTVVVSNSPFETNLSVVGNLLFANSLVYDISNRTPVQVATIPLPIETVWGAEGNNVLTSRGSFPEVPEANYTVVNISSPSNPLVQENVTDITTWDIFNPSHATWAGNGRFYAADGTGGIAVYNASARGGPARLNGGYSASGFLRSQTRM